MSEFCEATELRERMFMGDESRLGNFIFIMFKIMMFIGWMDRAKARGFLRYSSLDAVWAMASEDLKALEDLLSDDNYFFGQLHPSTLDCTVFGHLSQFLYIRIDLPQQKYIKESCPKLLRFMEQFKQMYFPDWEALCQKQPNEAMKAGSPKVQKGAKLKQAAMFGAATLLVAVGMGAKLYFSNNSSSQEL